MRIFQKIIFIFLFSVSCFCRADVCLTTSSGQEVYLTDSQFYYIRSMYGILQDFFDYHDETSNFQTDILNVFLRLATTDPSFITNAANNEVFNLYYYSNTYSNLLSRFLSAYTNNLSHQFSALPTQNWLETRWNSLFSQIDALNSPLVNNYFHIYDEQVPNYYFDSSWERMITYTRNNQFDYVYNSNYNPLWKETISGMPYDLKALRDLYIENVNLLNQWKYIGYERDNPIAFSNQLIKVNALLKLWEDKRAVFANTYKSSLLQADNWKNGYVDSSGDFISWDSPYLDGKPQVISDLIAFNPFQMPLNEAFETATNYLGRLLNPNDAVFGDLDSSTKEVYISEIQKEISSLADVQTQKQLDDFINGLQQMLNTMSNCCQNMSYLPYIADMVSNLVENVGNDKPDSGSGDSTNDNSNIEIPLGFAPSETNSVDYFTDWSNYTFDKSIANSTVNQVQSSFDNINHESHNRQSETVASNVVQKIVPVVNRFQNFVKPLVSKAPASKIRLIDTNPIKDFAYQKANIRLDIDNDSECIDIGQDSVFYTKILGPLHGFFVLFWLAIVAFLLIMSYLWLFRRFMGFRKYLFGVWSLFVKVLFHK